MRKAVRMKHKIKLNIEIETEKPDESIEKINSLIQEIKTGHNYKVEATVEECTDKKMGFHK